MTLMTEAMTISKYKSTKPPNLNLQGLTFKYSYEIKDLGVALDKNLNWKIMVEAQAKALFNNFNLINLIINFWVKI